MKKKIFTVLLCLSAIVGVSFAQRPKVSKKKSKAPITFFQTKEDLRTVKLGYFGCSCTRQFLSNQFEHFE